MLMAIDEQLPPACAFAVSVLEERNLNPDSVPEEAVEAAQSQLAANYAYGRLRLSRAAVFYDPSNPSSTESAGGFINNFMKGRDARIVAQETAVASGLLDANGRPQASRDDLLAGLNDALKAKPDLIYAPLLTNDVITL